MLKKLFKNKFIRIFDIVYLTIIASYTIRSIYLVMISPIQEPTQDGYTLIYYNRLSLLVGLILLILIFVILNLVFYIIVNKIKNRHK